MALKTYTQMLAEIAALWPDNLKKQITAATARTTLNDMVDSTLGSSNQNAADPGNDGILIIGDSTMVAGHSKVNSRDITNSRIFQWNQTAFSGLPVNTLNPASEPLGYPDAQQVGPPILIGPSLAFARRLINDRPGNRGLVLLPQAYVGSSLCNTFTVSGALGQNQGFAPPSKIAQCDILCTGGGTQGDTETINGVTMTSIAGPNAGLNFQFSATAQTYAENFRACINTNTVALGVNAPNAAVNAKFTAFANAAGSAGNVACDGTKLGVFYSFYFDALDNANGYATSAFGARFVGGSDAGGGLHYANAIAQANAFIAAAPAGTTNRIIAIVCGLGTNDTRMSATQWQTWLLGMVNGMRAAITNGSQIPFVLMGMVPEYALNIGGIGPGDFLKGKYTVATSIASLSNFSAFAPLPYGSADSTPFHPDALVLYAAGNKSIYDAYYQALGNEVAGFNFGPFITAVPITEPSTPHTVAPNTASVIFTNGGGCAVNMPDPAANKGRWLIFKTTSGGVFSNLFNVVPLVGGAAGQSIVVNTPGKFAMMTSDGTNWVIMAAN